MIDADPFARIDERPPISLEPMKAYYRELAAMKNGDRMKFTSEDQRTLNDLQVKKELAQQPLMDLVVRTFTCCTIGEIHSIVEGLTDHAEAFMSALKELV